MGERALVFEFLASIEMTAGTGFDVNRFLMRRHWLWLRVGIEFHSFYLLMKLIARATISTATVTCLPISEICSVIWGKSNQRVLSFTMGYAKFSRPDLEKYQTHLLILIHPYSDSRQQVGQRVGKVGLDKETFHGFFSANNGLSVENETGKRD